MTDSDFNFCPRCGALMTKVEKFGRIRPVCSQCGWIYFEDPKVAAAALVIQAGRVLLVRRVNEPFRGLWTLPAGFVNSGEDPAIAAARECLEETGLTVRALRVFDIVPGREHPRGADFVIIYLVELIGGVLRADDDADAVEWFDSDHLPPLAFRATRKALQSLNA